MGVVSIRIVNKEGTFIGGFQQRAALLHTPLHFVPALL